MPHIYKRLLDLGVDSTREPSNGRKAVDIALKTCGRFSERVDSLIKRESNDFFKLEREVIERLIKEGKSDD